MNRTALDAFNAARLTSAYALHGTTITVGGVAVNAILSARDTRRSWDAGGVDLQHTVGFTIQKTALTVTRAELEDMKVELEEGDDTRTYMVDSVTDDPVAGEWIVELSTQPDGR